MGGDTGKADLLTHGLITIVFYGVMQYPEYSATLIKRMSNKFLGKDFLSFMRAEQVSEDDLAKKPSDVFLTTFMNLFGYNVTLHIIALSVKCGVTRKTPSIAQIVNALREAVTLNFYVSLSCTIWFAVGVYARLKLSLPSSLSSFLSAFALPMPIAALKDKSVKQSLFFLFLPWTLRLGSNLILNSSFYNRFIAENTDEKSRYNSIFLQILFT